MRLSSLIQVVTTAVLAVQASSPGFGQATPHGDQFQINTFTPNSQHLQAVASDALGKMVVVWQSYGEIGDTGNSVQGQLYAADGTPQGSQFQANSHTVGFQAAPRVARRPDGEFVVVWHSFSSTGTDNSISSIQARRFAADGTPQAAEFQVNSYTSSTQSVPDVAIDDQGEFVVVWQSRGSFGDDQDGYSIQGRRFSADDLPLGAEFQVNGDTTGHQTRGRVAVDGAGNFWVVYQTAAAVGSDPDGSIQARFYDSNGTPTSGPSFTLNTHTGGAQEGPAIAADDAGTFLAVWESFDSAGGDTSGRSIQGYWLNASGEPLGDDFQVNTYTTGSQFRAAVGGAGTGAFIASWESSSSGGTDTTSSVQARQFDATLSNDFQVNTITQGVQTYPGVAADANGNFVVVWQTEGGTASDPLGSSVQGQFYDALFRDGFETNDTGRWSSAVP